MLIKLFKSGLAGFLWLGCVSFVSAQQSAESGTDDDPHFVTDAEDNFSQSNGYDVSAVTMGQLPLALGADFENKILGDPIGTGGAALGEPVSIDNGLITEVVESGMGNQALILQHTSNSTQGLEWELLGDIEFTTGTIDVSMDLNFPTLDQYSITFVNARDADNFFTLVTFAATGSIGVTDNNGFAGFVGNYQADQDYQLKITIDSDNGLYDVEFDGNTLLGDHPHDFNSGNGMPLLFTSFQSSAEMNSIMVIDNVEVRAVLLDSLIFSNGFE